MAVYAQLADGRMLEFPDGTDPVIIQSTVKKVIAGSIGSPSALAETKAKPESESVFRQVADVPLNIAKGVTQGVRMIADAFGAGSETSKNIKGAEDYIAGLMSAQSKNDSKEVARIMKEAEDKGVLENVKAAFKAFTVAPLDLLSSALGTSAPTLVAALGATLFAPAAAVGTVAGATALGLGAVMGAGTVKGTIYEETKKALKEAGIKDEKRIEEVALKAQEYGGKNLDMILAGAGFGALAGRTGAERQFIDSLSKRILTKAAAKEAAGTAATKEVAKEIAKEAPKTGVVAGAKKVVTEAGKEAAPEFAQAGQEKLAENIALQRVGEEEGIKALAETPTMRGVFGAATLEFLTGAALGGTLSVKEAIQIARGQGATDEEVKKLKDVIEQRKEPEIKTKVPLDAELTKDQQINALTQQLVQTRGMEEEDARKIAIKRVDELEAQDKKLADEAEEERKAKLREGLVIPDDDPRVQAYAGELLDNNVVSTKAEAIALAKKRVADEEAADAEDVTEPPVAGGGEGVSVSGRPSGGVPTEGAAPSIDTGVAGTELSAEPTVRREEAPPGAVESLEDLVAQNAKIFAELQDVIARRDEVKNARAKLSEIPDIRVPDETPPSFSGTYVEQAKQVADYAANRLKLLEAAEKQNAEKDRLKKESDKLYKEENALVDKLLESNIKIDNIQTKETPSVTEAPKTQQAKEERKAAPAEGTEVAKPAAKAEPSKSAALSGAPVNNQLLTATNATQGIAAISKTGDPLQTTLANRLRASTTNVPIVTLEEGDPVPAQIADNKILSENWDVATAMYVGPSFGTPTIYLRGASFGDRQSVNNVDALHEITHAALDRKIITAENMLETRGLVPGVAQDPLVRGYQELQETMMLAQQAYDEAVENNTIDPRVLELGNAETIDVFNNLREFAAYGTTNPAFVKFLKSVKTPDKYSSTGRDKTLFTKFVEAVRKILGLAPNQFNALVDLLDITDRLAGTKITPYRTGTAKIGAAIKQELRKRQPVEVSLTKQKLTPEEQEALKKQKEIDKKVDEAIEKLAKSRTSEEVAKQASLLYRLRNGEGVLDSLRALWKGMDYKGKSILVKGVTTDALVQWADEIPRLAEINQQLQSMSGMAQKLMGAAADLSKKINTEFSKSPELRRKLEDITKIATLSQIDPATDSSNTKLNDMYKDLGAKGQQLYKDIKQYYDDMAELYTSLLDDQIEQANIPPEAKTQLLAAVKKMYEKGERIYPYFPLTRDGSFWLAVYTGKNKEKEFYMFPTMAERDAVAKKLAEDRKTELDELLDIKKFEIGNDIRSMRLASTEPSSLLKSTFKLIDESNFTDENIRDDMKDAVYQMYLRTMPEQTFRKQFIHRKGYAGFSTDLLRDFNESSLKMSLQLARLKYAPKLRNTLASARDSIQNRPEFEPFVAEMEKRVKETLNPRIPNAADAIAGWANKLSFIYYLSGASSALLQPIGIVQTGIPILGARHGYGATAAEMAKLMKVWDSLAVTRKTATGDEVNVMPSIVNSTAVNASPEERKAVEAMLARDVTQSTYARALYDYNNIPSEKIGSPLDKTKKTVNFVLGGLMHSTERISREIIFLTSYRLSKRKNPNISEKDAIDQAVQDTNDALGNYGEYNRPMIMRNPGGKIALQFQMYPLHVTMYLVKNFKRMIAGKTKAEKAEAAKIFWGTMATTWMLAGAAGLPMFSVVMGLLGMAWNAADDDEKPKDIKDLDFEIWSRTIFLPEILGDVTIGGKKLSSIIERGLLNAFTGVDFASRTQLNDLWFRDIKETKTTRESLEAWAIEKAGPAVNMVLNWADAYEAFRNGDYQKGVEKLSPALIRNFILTHKYATEGAKNNKGAQIMSKDAFTTGELIGQAIGFRSDLLANTQNVTFKLIGIQQRIENERQKLFDNIDREYRTRDFKAYNQLITKDLVAFNKKYPSFRIDVEQLQDSLERRAKDRGESWRGLRLSEKNAALLAPAAAPSRKAVAERERQRRIEVYGTSSDK